MKPITLEMHVRLLHEEIAQLQKATKTKDNKKRYEAIKERDEYLKDNGYRVVNILDINGYHITYAIHEYLFDDSIMNTRTEENGEEPSWAVIELDCYYFEEDEFIKE